jgi:predicted membrane-bound spermidine synthase
VAPAAPAPAARAAGALAPPLVLACFALSGFVAIGYEILWARIFGVVMEGTLYGFSAVLASFLLGLAFGSAAIARRADAIRDPALTFARLHAAIAASALAGMAAVPYLPYAIDRLAGGVHGAFLLVLPLVLVPTALFGAAFPLLIRLHARSAADTGRSFGIATAANTAGSIAASAIVSFWCIPRLGTDGSLRLLVLLELGLAAFVLLRVRRGLPGLPRLAGMGALAASFVLAFGGVRIDRAIAGRQIGATSLEAYRSELARRAATQTFLAEGREAVVTVYDRPGSRLLRSNGLPEADFQFAPPYYPVSSVLLGALPALLAEHSERALVIGLGGGNTLRVLTETPLAEIDVVELEQSVAAAQEALYRGRANPLSDPRVRLRVDDGRHHLLREARSDAPRYDVIASQPSHPWRVGAANLFTEEFFRLVHARLADGGCFALWINGFRMDEASLLAVLASFERVFPGAALVDASAHGDREDLLLVGGRRPLAVDVARVAARLRAPALAARLAPYELDRAEALLARFEAPAAAFAALAPGAANTDDNAFVETRVARLHAALDYAALEARLAPGTPVLPPLSGALDTGAVADALLGSGHEAAPLPTARKLARLLETNGASLAPPRRALLEARARLRAGREAEARRALAALAAAQPGDPGALRALGRHLALARGDFAAAADAFAQAFARSASADDAYDAGRSLQRVDPARAARWFERIPARERTRFPRLALYAAERALAEHAPRRELAALCVALLAYRDTEEGREFPSVNAVLARLSRALGDEAAARDFSAAARHEPGGPGARALADARFAQERGDAAGVAAALRELRFWAPSLRAGIGAENRFRSEHGLPLLPERPLEELAAPAA